MTFRKALTTQPNTGIKSVGNTIRNINSRDYQVGSLRVPYDMSPKPDPNLGVQPRRQRFNNMVPVRTESGDFFTPNLPRGQGPVVRVSNENLNFYSPYEK